MKTKFNKIPNLILPFFFFFMFLSQGVFSQKDNHSVIINNGIQVMPKITNNCDCNTIEFKIRVIKLSQTLQKTIYRLQIIDFENKNKCKVNFLKFEWKNQISSQFSKMKKINEEHAPDGEFSLYEYNFESKTNKDEPADGSPISTLLQISIGGNNCLFENKQSTYFRRM